MVGRDTLLTAVTVLPASSVVPVFAYSGPGMGFMSGGVPGHSGICTWPAEGCQAVSAACAPAHASSRHRTMIHSFMTLLRAGARSGSAWWETTAPLFPSCTPLRTFSRRFRGFFQANPLSRHDAPGRWPGAGSRSPGRRHDERRCNRSPDRGELSMSATPSCRPTGIHLAFTAPHQHEEPRMYDMKNLSRLKKLDEQTPDAMQAFRAFDKAAFTAGALDARQKQLIAVAVALTTQCPYCIEIHTRAARDAGADDTQLAETAMVAAAIRAGGAITHASHLLHD